MSPQRPERGAHLLREQLWLLPGGEVAAPLSVVEVHEVRIDLLHPASRRLEDLTREGRECNRH